LIVRGGRSGSSPASRNACLFQNNAKFGSAPHGSAYTRPSNVLSCQRGVQKSSPLSLDSLTNSVISVSAPRAAHSANCWPSTNVTSGALPPAIARNNFWLLVRLFEANESLI